MAVDHVKSTVITNLDANTGAPTAGEGGMASLLSITGNVTGIAASSIDATYQFVRVPSNCKIKQLLFRSAAQAVGTMDMGLYYATDGEGGKPTSLLVANTINRTLFSSATSVAAASGQIDLLATATTSFTAVMQNQPLWQAAGLASDPGGYFDIVGSLATALTTGTGIMSLTVNYTI
jgi:hypothetical protein